MTWTYEPTKLGERDAEGYFTPAAMLAGVRFLVGDNDNSDEDSEMVQDEEIMYVVAQWLPKEGTLEYCASVIADTIANRYAREVSYSADGVSVGLGSVAQQFRELANALRAQHRALMLGGGPDGGGINAGEQADLTINPFSFGTQMHDNWEAGHQDFGSRGRPYYVAEEQPGV